ncbi:hypothetical protein, variant 1 [Aphanomyces astaci]|uniref:UDENN domain-containing protein n=2 Tax=Aphanomyces astaci TaxID=112090 RepID=W4GF23_APHAT|nr:hypothetical protein, variant 1 [Aphanomyces astaci]ETV78297.1 hypothetical protein, variant 1 [Aphanomyces astaci]|eukprot:XP_009831878.1 hypothetical protein, variant 1 [Aphanomyces astaci]
MDSLQDQGVVDDKAQRSLFIRVRNLTPSKSMRSPSRNFMDRWTSKPQSPTSEVEKGPKSSGLHGLLDKDAAAPEPLPSLVSAQESVNLRVFQSVTLWLKENGVLYTHCSSSLTPPTNQTRVGLHQVYDTLFNSIDQQDNQLTNELLELNSHVLPPVEGAVLSCSRTNIQQGSNSTNSLFDAVVVVGPDLTDILISHDLDATFDPVVCHTYPSDVVFESIQHFCFPNGVRLVSDDGRRPTINSSETDSDTEAGDDDDYDSQDDNDSKLDDEFFVFVLSGGGKEGQDVQYALCRQTWVRVPNHMLLKPQGATYVPLTYCLLVKMPYIPFFRTILHHVMDKHVLELDEHPALWADLSTLMTPSHQAWLDSKLNVLATMDMPTIHKSIGSDFFDKIDLSALQLDRPRRRLPSLTSTSASDDIPPALLLEWSLPIVLTSMTMDSVLQTIAALLLEMKVLVVCDDIELLTATVLGVVSLLAPLVWTGPLIAVLPSSLSEYLEAPVPFVIGVQALPVGYVAPSDTLQLFPQSNRVVANALPLPDSDTFKADLLAMSLRRDSAYVDHIIERFRAYMQALLRKCNGQNPGPHAFYDCVKATQLFSSYQQRNEDIKQSRDGAIRHLKLEPRAPLIPRKSVSSNQHESTTLMVHNLFQVVCHGEVPASLHPPPEVPPTAAISALAKLRMMCAGTDKGALDDTPSPLELRKTSAPLSPRPKPETITLVLRKDPSGVSVVNPMTQEMGVKPPPSHLSVSPSLVVPPTTHAPLLSTKSVRIIEPEQINLACNVSTPPTLSNPTLDDVDSSELPEQGVEHTTSATKIQRLYRQWSFKKHRVLYSRCNSTPTPPALSENTMISTHDLASVIQAKTLFVAGVLVSKLGRHGTWGRRRLRSDSTIDHLMWEKVTGKHRVSGNSMVSFRDITLVEAGIKGSQRTTVMGSLLFASTDHDEMDLCWTVHTSDSRRRAVVFKASSTAERQRVMADLQSLVTYTLLSSGQVVLSSHTIGATEGELVVLRKFKDELRAGICIRKHGRQGKPHAKYLSCDAMCTQLEWRDPPTSGGRGWLKRASSLQHANIDDPKNVIAFASIQHVTPSESTSPHRSFIGSAQHYQRISIVSSVRTLVISTDPPQDLMRVYHGLNLLVRHLRIDK